MFFRKQCSSLKYHWCETSLLSQAAHAVEACGVQRFHLQEVYARNWFCIRDEPILLFISPIFLSGKSFFLTYYAQYFAPSCDILLKV